MSARVVSRRALRYRRGADPSCDRPGHVRAASGLCWIGRDLVVVQDDARFVGVIDLATGLVDDFPLPPGPGGRRVFDEGLGNKADKPDLEVALADGDRLLALGSGGPLPARQGIVRWRRGEEPVWQAATALYARLAAALGTVNLEGGVLLGAQILLAQRGGHHGAPDVLVRTSAASVRAAAVGREEPAPLDLVEVALGAIDGVALHWTDLCLDGDTLWFSAAAEATDDFFADGPVVGAAIGHLVGGAEVVLAEVLDEQGARSTDKIEGLAPHHGRLLAVTDPDDPERPGELLELVVG